VPGSHSFIGCTCLSLLITGAAAAAQTYPDKPIRMLVGFAPGGTADIVARALAPRLTDQWRQPIVIDNRAGAGSVIASDLTAKAPPDGYTVVMISSSHAINAGLHKKLPYDSEKDFSGVALVASAPLVLVVYNGLAARSVQELVSLARTKPGQLNYASSGSGGTSHLAAELFNRMAGIRLFHVPYKGAAPALADVMSGQVQIIFPALPTTLAQIRSGRLRALGVTSTRRAASLPDVPTIAEAGVAGYDAANWYALLAPAHTPKAFIATLNAGIVQALRSTEISEALLRQGADAIPSTPAECERYLTSEIAKWRTVIGDAGIRAE
jgi:tripartite-type tricarboxylate transporter receptor subunit TctC